jgi:hypothetical protein
LDGVELRRRRAARSSTPPDGMYAMAIATTSASNARTSTA